jgi:hypothetical protein
LRQGAQIGLRFVAVAGAGKGLANPSLSAVVGGQHRLQSRGPRSKKGQAMIYSIFRILNGKTIGTTHGDYADDNAARGIVRAGRDTRY